MPAQRRAARTGPISQDLITSSFLLGNLHCPSCVSAIKTALVDEFRNRIRWVSPNVVTSVVTVQHDMAVSTKAISHVLEDAGFEVQGISSSDNTLADLSSTTTSPSIDATSTSGATHSTRFPLPRWVTSPSIITKGKKDAEQQAQKHLDSCRQCQEADGACHDATTTTAEIGISDTTLSEKLPADDPHAGALTASSSDGQTDVEKASFARGPIFRATVAIGGMTCASCVNAVTQELQQKDYVASVSVNLVSNSASVDFVGKDNADGIVEAIEDIGYDATLDNVIELGQQNPTEQHERIVEIRIDGVYCEHCPSRVATSLAGFRKKLEIVQESTKAYPVLKVAYVPEAPTFTIRQIVAAIEASDPALKASIFHPPSLEQRSRQTLRKHQLHLLYRVIFTALVAVPTLIIGVVYMSLVSDNNTIRQFLTSPWTSGISRAQIALFIMATPVYFFAADVFHTRAIKEIRTIWRKGSRIPILQRFYRFGSMNTLMSLGTTIAYVSSVAQMIAAAAQHVEMADDSSFYFDSVVFLTLFLLLGRLIESYSKSKTGSAVEALGKLRPTEAILVEKIGSEKEADTLVKADWLDFGDTVRIPHGASPPADGIVLQGQTSFDESSLTGESRLVSKWKGEQVFAGTVNQGSPILIKIIGTAGTSMLDQIVNVVREGQTKRAPMEQIADLLTMYFVPIVTLIALVTWLIWLAVGYGGAAPQDYLDGTNGGWIAFSLQFAIAVFVVACPCGLGLAAPTAIFVGGGLAAKHGILAKGGGEAFEKASKIDCVVFDKTGTLTMGGEPLITDFELFPEDIELAKDGMKVDEMLTALRAVEGNSVHSFAEIIVGFCKEKISADADVEVSKVEEIAGKGLKAVYTTAGSKVSTEILVGNEALLSEFGVTPSSTSSATLLRWKQAAKSLALVAQRQLSFENGSKETPWTIAALFAISDAIRPEAPTIIKALQARGTRVWMLSGDNAITAAAVASQIGVHPQQVISGVLPTEKADKIKYLQETLKSSTISRKHKDRKAIVAMVGDGINDSPALATADIGIAIGSGSDIAISSASFVLVSSDLRSVVTLLDLSSAVFRRIKFNFAWALIYNIIALPVAAGVLYPVKSGGGHVRLDPVWASLAMALSSISVVTSSLLLRSRVPGVGFRERRIEIGVKDEKHEEGV